MNSTVFDLSGKVGASMREKRIKYVLTLNREDMESLRASIESANRIGSGIVIFKGIAMERRSSEHVLEVLQTGEPKIPLVYEDWQVVYRHRGGHV